MVNSLAIEVAAHCDILVSMKEAIYAPHQ